MNINRCVKDFILFVSRFLTLKDEVLCKSVFVH